MNKPPKRPIAVSDHAVIRYLERGKGIDIERLRDEIRSIVGAAMLAGATSITHQGVTFEIAGQTITTVLTRSMHRRSHKERYSQYQPKGAS